MYMGAIRYGIFLILLAFVAVWFIILRQYAKKHKQVDKLVDKLIKPFKELDKVENQADHKLN